MGSRRAGEILAESEDCQLMQVTSLQGYDWQDLYVDHLTIVLNTEFYDDYITTHFQNFVDRHFPPGRRGYLLAAGKDVVDAGQAAMLFLQMFAKRRGLGYRVFIGGSPQNEKRTRLLLPKNEGLIFSSPIQPQYNETTDVQETQRHRRQPEFFRQPDFRIAFVVRAEWA